jgi:hypothetical protein
MPKGPDDIAPANNHGHLGCWRVGEKLGGKHLPQLYESPHDENVYLDRAPAVEYP